MIYKLTNLRRLLFVPAVTVLIAYIKKAVSSSLAVTEKGMLEYYNRLIKMDGRMLQRHGEVFVSSFFKNRLLLKMRNRPSSDISVLNQVFDAGEYRMVVAKFKENFNVHDPRIIDAGANIGLTSVYFSTCFDKPAFISIEPDDENFALMSFNLDSNNINAVKLKAGLWNRNTNLQLIRDFRDMESWSVRVVESDGDGLCAYTIDRLLDDQKWTFIDILKIDIEGSEKQVFTAAGANLDFLDVTKCIAMEIHDEFDCREEICQILNARGFDLIDSGELTIGINSNLRAGV